MRWNRFFEDLEHELDSGLEVQQASVDGEAERLRVSRLELRTRFLALSGSGVLLELAGGSLLIGRLVAGGADWIGLIREPGGAALVPLRSIHAIRIGREAMLASVGAGVGASADAGAGRDSAKPARTSLSERQTFGYVLRDLARRRIAVVLQQNDERALAGTIDRVGADHLDLALHDRGAPRREAEVSGYRIVPLAAVAWVKLDESSAMFAA